MTKPYSAKETSVIIWAVDAAGKPVKQTIPLTYYGQTGETQYQGPSQTDEMDAIWIEQMWWKVLAEPRVAELTGGHLMEDFGTVRVYSE